MFDQPSDAHNGASREEPYAEETEARFASLRMISGEDVAVEQSLVQQATGHDVDVRQSVVGLASGENVALEQSVSALTVGRNVAVNGGTSIFLLAPTVRGNVRTLFDIRSAAALAVGYVLARQVVRVLGRLFQRD